MNTYTNKFQAQQFTKIKEFFVSKNSEFSQLPYGQWKAISKGFNASLYNSGKFVLQGKDIDNIAVEFEQFMGILTIAETQSIHTVPKSQETLDLSFSEYIGTDESGKGDFFGPLIIAGVYTDKTLAEKFKQIGVKDSKKLDDKTIIKLSAHIRNSAPHSVVTIMPEKYNELYQSFKNLNKLLAWGHARAIENVLDKQKCKYAISDKFGDETLIKNALMKNGKEITLEQRTKGEAYTSVAAASVIARAEFVKRCEELKKKYGIDFPKGASDKVVSVGKDFVRKCGREELKYVAKMHFKTVQLL